MRAGSGGGADDRDRARRRLQQAPTDRSQQQAGEAAVAPRTGDQQRRARSFVSDRDGGLADDEDELDLHTGMAGLVRGERVEDLLLVLGENALRELIEVEQ